MHPNIQPTGSFRFVVSICNENGWTDFYITNSESHARDVMNTQLDFGCMRCEWFQ